MFFVRFQQTLKAWLSNSYAFFILFIDPFHATGLFLYPLKISEHLRIPHFFRGYERNCGAIKWAKNVSKKAWYCIQNTLDKIYFRCIVLSFLKNRLHIWQKMTNTMPNDFLWVSFDANEKNKAIFSSLYFFRVHKLDIMYIWEKVFKSKPSKICGRKPLKNLKGYGLLKQTISLQFF